MVKNDQFCGGSCKALKIGKPGRPQPRSQGFLRRGEESFPSLPLLGGEKPWERGWVDLRLNLYLSSLDLF